uniref:Uncharacterized protein n=1 Tax=Solanum tuberosum TaxID=4113 RepID=M1CXS2_SOLTU
MLSTSETECAVSAMRLVLRYGPFSGSALSNLVAVLRDRLADVVANLKFEVNRSNYSSREW